MNSIFRICIPAIGLAARGERATALQDHGPQAAARWKLQPGVLCEQHRSDWRPVEYHRCNTARRHLGQRLEYPDPYRDSPRGE